MPDSHGKRDAGTSSLRGRQQCSVVLIRQAVTTTTGGVSVTITVVIVPDGADIAGVGFEEEAGWSEDAGAWTAANGAGDGRHRLAHRPIVLKAGAADRAGVVVAWHLTPFPVARSPSLNLPIVHYG